MIYKDSLGNSYSKLPTKPPTHKAKSTRNKESKRARSAAKKNRHDKYRALIGKPLGPGVKGAKAGRNKVR